MQDFNQNPIFSKAEVQQLRKLLSEEIHSLEVKSFYSKDNAQRFKVLKPSNNLADLAWKDHFKARAKIKKLAALQVKLKMVQELY